MTTTHLTESPTSRKRFAMPRLSPFRVFSAAIALLLAFLSLFPLSKVLSRLFIRDGSLDLSAIGEAFDTPGLGKVLYHTGVIVLGSGVLSVMIGSFLAWISERTDARMGLLTDGVPLLPFILPPVAGAVGWVMLFTPKTGLFNAFIRWLLSFVGIDLKTGPFNIFSLYGMILAYTVFMVPLVFLLVSTGLRNMDPALEEQSQVCGAGIPRTFFRVTIAALRPNLAGAVLLIVWFGMAMFSVPSIIGSRSDIEVLSVRIVRLLNFTYPAQTDVAVGLCMFMVVAVGAAWFVQRRIVSKGHFATVGGKGHRGTPIPLGRWKLPVRLFAIGYMTVASVLPMVALALVALNGFWTPKIKWSELKLDLFRQVLFEDESIREAIFNSVRLGVLGGLIGITAATILALFVQSSGGWAPKLIDVVVRLPASISGLVLAVGVLLAFAGPPFKLHNTLIILLIAYVVLYMPQASVAADAAVSQVGKELPEASAVSGAGGWRTFRKIHIPIMAGGLISGWAMLFVVMTGELQAAALLSSATSNRTVGFAMLDAYNNGAYAPLAALALVLTVVTSTVVVVALLVVRRQSRWGRGRSTTIGAPG